MNRWKRGFIRKLVLSKIIAKKELSERVFRGFKPNRQRNVVPIIFSNNSWTKFSYIDSIEIEADSIEIEAEVYRLYALCLLHRLW